MKETVQKSGRPSGLILAALLAILVAGTFTVSRAAILYLEEFDPDANGWDSASSDAVMNVDHDPGFYMIGLFAAQVFPVPETDAFRIDSGTDFIGNYNTLGITQISFELTAVHVLPSDLFINIIDGSNVFSYQFTSLVMNGAYTVNLAWSYGWMGLSEAAFNAALTSVDAMEIQITRSGTGAQSYYLDNVTTLDTDIGDPGGGGSAVPEPTVIVMFLSALLTLMYYRRLVWKVRMERE